MTGKLKREIDVKVNSIQSKPARELFAEASVFKLVNGIRREAQLQA